MYGDEVIKLGFFTVCKIMEMLTFCLVNQALELNLITELETVWESDRHQVCEVSPSSEEKS